MIIISSKKYPKKLGETDALFWLEDITEEVSVVKGLSMYFKGGPGSGIEGHRTLRGSTSKLTPKKVSAALEKLREMRERRSDDARSGKKKRAVRGHYSNRSLSEKNKRRVLKEELGLDDKKITELLGTLKQYTMKESYKDVRKGSEKGKKLSDTLEQYISKAPIWDGIGTLYRGITLPNELIEKLKVGSVFDMKGVSSWTSEKGVAESFGTRTASGKKGCVTFAIPEVTRGTSITHLSYFPTWIRKEKEILVSGKSKFRIEKIEGNTKRQKGEDFVQITVHVREV